MRSGYGLALLATALFASGYIFNYYLTQRMASETAALWVFAAAALIGAALIARAKKEDRLLLRRHGRHVLLFGALNGVGAILWFHTLSSAGPAITGFLFRFITVFSVLLGVLLLRERFDRREVAGIALVIAGAFIITYTDLSLLPVAAAAIAGSFLFAVVGFLSTTRLKSVTPLMLNSARVIIMFCIVGAYAVFHGKALVPPLNELAVAFISAALTAVLGMALFFTVVRRIGLSVAALIGALEPLFIVFLSLIVLQSAPTPVQLLGGLVLMAGIAVILLSRKKPTIVAEA